MSIEWIRKNYGVPAKVGGRVHSPAGRLMTPIGGHHAMSAPGSIKHRWGERVAFGLHKTERQCLRCELVKVTRHESEGGRAVHWTEWWRDQEKIASDLRPRCDARLEVAP